MTTLDELTSSLDRYADRDDARGAAAVWDDLIDGGPVAAPLPPEHPPSRRPLVIVLAAVAACILLVVTVALVRTDDDPGVVTSPEPAPIAGSRPVPAIEVSGPGEVVALEVAFDRIWVTTTRLDASESNSWVHSFAIDSGAPLGTVELEGKGGEIVATDGAVWVQTSVGWASRVDETTGERQFGLLHQLDPATGAAVADQALLTGGPMAARGHRLAVADGKGIRIIDDQTGTVATATIAETLAQDAGPPGTEPPTFSFASLAFTASGLVGIVPTGETTEVSRVPLAGIFVQMDPDTGRNRSSLLFEVDPPFRALLAPTERTTWLVQGESLVPLDVADGPIEPAGPAVPIGAPAEELLAIGDDVVARTGSSAVMAVGNGTTTTELDPSADGAIVTVDGRPWIAQWHDAPESGPTVISFVEVRTDPTTPSAEIATTTDPPPSTMIGNGAPTLVLMEDDALIDGEAYALVGAGLTPGPVVVSVCLRDDDGTNPCWSAFDPPQANVGVVSDDGQFTLAWRAQRSIYDSRWHDCAIEDCVLRLHPITAAGGRDTTTVLAETPTLAFSGDAPPIRPTISVAPAGPLTVGSTVTITAEHLIPQSPGVSIGLCRTGVNDGSCRFDLASMERTVDGDGRLVVTFTIQTGTIEMPSLDPTRAEIIDCAAAPGACSFSIFPMEGSHEPYATLPIELSD